MIILFFSGGLLAVAFITTLVIIAHHGQRKTWSPAAIEPPRRIALPAPAPSGETWSDHVRFDLPAAGEPADEIADADVIEDAGAPCEGPECSRELPEYPWRAGSDLDSGPDAGHKFCSEACQLGWLSAERELAGRGRRDR
jgi:hypothetical protein